MMICSSLFYAVLMALPAVKACYPDPNTAYYTNSAFDVGGSANPPCAQATLAYSSTVYGDHGDYVMTEDTPGLCRPLCQTVSQSCKAYVQEDVDMDGSGYSVNCYFYTSQAPPAISCDASNFMPPNTISAFYRDEVNSCFQQSIDQAVRFCSNWVSARSDIITDISFTATVSPVQTSTVYSYATKSLCSVPGLRQPIDLNAAMATDQPAAPTNPAQFPTTTPAPKLRRAHAARAEMAAAVAARGNDDNDAENIKRNALLDKRLPLSIPPPECLNTIAFPDWDITSGCQCLTTISTLTDPGIFTASTSLLTVSLTTTTKVQKASIPTFQPIVNVPAAGGSSSPAARFNLLSRIIADANGQSRRVLTYTKAAKQAVDDNVDMHITPGAGTPGKDKKMYVISQSQHVLKSYGKVPFVVPPAVKGGQKITYNVLGELADGTNGSGSLSESYSCVVSNKNVVGCTLDSKGTKAVFSEVLVPGTKDRYLLVVDSKVVQGGRAVTLVSTKPGTVIVGCAGSGQ